MDIIQHAGRELLAGRFVGVHLEHQPQLFEVICTGGAARRFPGATQRGQQNRRQNTNNGDHYQQLNKCKTFS